MNGSAPLFDVARLTALGRVGEVAPCPDGTWLAVVVQRLDEQDAKYVSDLWRVSLEDPSAPPTRLTRGEQNDRAPRFRRDGSLGFLSSRNPREGKPQEGDEDRAQVWILPAGGGEPRPLTDEPLGVTDFRFAAEASELVVVAEVLPDVPLEEQRARKADRDEHGPSALRYDAMPVRQWDHWIGDAVPHVVAYGDDGADGDDVARGRRDLTPEARDEHRELEWDLSRDGERVVVTTRRLGADRIHDVALRVIDVATGDARDLASEPRVACSSPTLSPDGRRIAASRERRFADACPTVELVVYDVDGGDARVLAPSWDRWASPECFTEDGGALLVTADDAGTVPVFRVGLGDGAEPERITAAEAGGSHGCIRAVAGGGIVGVRSRLLHPPEPFRCALEPGATPELAAHLSGFEPGEGERIARWESMTVESTDGTGVQSFLVTPAEASGPCPTLLWIHGGPISAWQDGWHWRWNALVPAAAGYALALPNPRGSTGFGQSFIAGIWGNTWGAQCYEDLMAVVRAAEAHEAVDGERVAAMGGSFGGYMTNWIGGQTDRFRCLVTHASLFDLSAFYGVTDGPGWFALQLAGNPHEDREAFERYSPHRHVRRWRSPTLIIHGDKDYRVPVSEALALFEALQLQRVPSELLVFPDENHWIARPRNVRTWYETVLEFLDRHLGG